MGRGLFSCFIWHLFWCRIKHAASGWLLHRQTELPPVDPPGTGSYHHLTSVILNTLPSLLIGSVAHYGVLWGTLFFPQPLEADTDNSTTKHVTDWLPPPLLPQLHPQRIHWFLHHLKKASDKMLAGILTKIVRAGGGGGWGGGGRICHMMWRNIWTDSIPPPFTPHDLHTQPHTMWEKS